MKRRLPLLAFLLLALLGWAGAAAMFSASSRTEALRFTGVVDEASNRIRERLRLHLLAIEATAAIIEAQGDTMTAARFAEYYEKLQLAERNPGIAGLGFAPLLHGADLPALAGRLQTSYGRVVEIWPQPGGALSVPVALLGSPDTDPPRAIGFDMYSEPVRRAAIDAAIAARAPRATEPLRLATDAAPLPGFIVYAPIYSDSFGVTRRPDASALPTGFAFGGFRIGQLTSAALDVPPRLPVALSVADSDAPDVTLYASGAPARGELWLPGAESREIEIAGQTWILTFHPSTAFRQATTWPLALGFGVISTALALAAAMALREQARVRETAEALAEAGQRGLAERDLLLQEMKHRIKNAISRILAIARQTAAQADSLDAFTDSFTQRLQAMAEAQDMLTRSANATADLADLLSRELGQVFGADFHPERLRGPAIQLDASRTQALGLVFHELATNALKYGGAAGGVPEIDVSWTLTGGARAPALDLCWRERGGGGVEAPRQTGFGTRLIDASLRHELGGRVERDWTPEGLSLRMIVPLGPAR